MALPADEDLNAMAELIAGLSFSELGPEARIQVIGLVNQCDLIDAVERVRNVLDDIENDTTTVADWFRNSKVYYP